MSGLWILLAVCCISVYAWIPPTIEPPSLLAKSAEHARDLIAQKEWDKYMFTYQLGWLYDFSFNWKLREHTVPKMYHYGAEVITVFRNFTEGDRYLHLDHVKFVRTYDQHNGIWDHGRYRLINGAKEVLRTGDYSFEWMPYKDNYSVIRIVMAEDEE